MPLGETKAALSWDEYFHAVAQAVALKSKDPSSQVGALLVNSDRLVVSTGFNGLVRKLPDDAEVLEDRGKKLKWIFHAEQNAILNAARLGISPLGCTLYVTRFPCFSCCQAIVQSGIVRVCTLDDDYWNNDPLDGDHQGKRYVLRQANIAVHAPNHWEYSAATPALKPSATEDLPSRIGDSSPPPANQVKRA